jgi:hypothetical protein
MRLLPIILIAFVLFIVSGLYIYLLKVSNDAVEVDKETITKIEPVEPLISLDTAELTTRTSWWISDSNKNIVDSVEIDHAGTEIWHKVNKRSIPALGLFCDTAISQDDQGRFIEVSVFYNRRQIFFTGFFQPGQVFKDGVYNPYWSAEINKKYLEESLFSIGDHWDYWDKNSEIPTELKHGVINE